MLGKADDDGFIGEESLRIADIEWRTARALNARDAAAVLDVVGPHLAGAAADPVVAAHLKLDWQEVERLGRRIGRSLPYRPMTT